MNALSALNQMLILLILLLVGVVCAKTGVIDRETNTRLSNLTLVVPQSAMILSSVINAEIELSFSKVALLAAAALTMYALLLLLGLLVPLILHTKKADRGIYTFMTMFGNVGFMGFPVVSALLGRDAVFYAALFNIPFNLLAFTLGIRLLRKSAEKEKFSLRLLINPALVASLAAVLLAIIKLHIPEPVAEAVSMLGDMVVPCSMLVIGSSLGQCSLKTVFSDWRTYAFSPFKLVAAPVLVWAVLRLFISDPMLLGVASVLSAMPTAAFATMLSIRYGGDENIASRTVFITSVLSVGTIPLICGVLF